MCDVFIVLSQSGTGISKALKFVTKKPFNHSSISLDSNLSEFYSFGRKVVNNPLNGGFVIEHKNTGVFEKFPNTPCLVLRLAVADEQYKIIKNTLDKFIINKDYYKYDFLNAGLINTKFHLKGSRKFFCSEFVAYVLKCANIDLPVSPEHIQPIDFLKLKNTTIIYEGVLQDYNI